MGFENLPVELFDYIVDLLATKYLIRLSSVCRGLNFYLAKEILHRLVVEKPPAIIFVVEFHNWAMAKALLHHGADINASWQGSTALMRACEQRDLTAVQFLLRQSDIDIALRDSSDETAMDIAIRMGASAIVRHFLMMDIDLQEEGRRVSYPLKHALDNEQYHIFQLILMDFRTVMDEKARINLKRTFHTAVRQGDCIAAEMILDRAQSSLVNLEEEHALLEIVQAFGEFTSPRFPIQMVDCLTSSCPDLNINHRDPEGRTALWHAVSTNDEQLVSHLLRIDGVNICECDIHGISPLAHAAQEGTDRIFSLLLRQSGVSTNAHGAYCVPPLWAASRAGHLWAVKELLSYRCIDANQPAPTGSTPLQVALSFGHVQIAHQLLSHEPRILVHQRDSNGLTALMIASSRGLHHIVRRLLRYVLIEINATDHWGRTALWHAAAGGQLELVQTLCAHPQVEINIPDDAGCTAWGIAEDHGHFDVSAFLGKFGSDQWGSTSHGNF